MVSAFQNLVVFLVVLEFNVPLKKYFLGNGDFF